ncbi:hypothetical protein ACQEVM_18660 [Streptomyces sp. CA-243310]|uniref:hypothetical protein n=1 Tax=Streptomyces sp. CA-243310 TaxID=3240056 RepID=UPI003D90C18C
MTLFDLRGSVRVTAGLHRRVLWGALALVLLAAIALPAGRWYVHSLAGDLAASGCEVENTVRGCGIPVRGFLARSLYVNKMFFFIALAVNALPLLLGAFVAGPLIGREFESGTFRFQWTQSVNPVHWLAARLAVPVAAVVLVLPAFVSLKASVWRDTLDTSYPIPWYDHPTYGAIGPVAVGYALLGIAVGALAGLLIGANDARHGRGPGRHRGRHGDPLRPAPMARTRRRRARARRTQLGDLRFVREPSAPIPPRVALLAAATGRDGNPVDPRSHCDARRLRVPAPPARLTDPRLTLGDENGEGRSLAREFERWRVVVSAVLDSCRVGWMPP